MQKTKIIRVRSGEFFDLVKDKLEDEDFAPGVYLQQLKDGLRQNPEGFLVLAVVSPEGEIVGFTINSLPNGFRYSYILQAWADPVKCPKEITQEVKKMNVVWTKLNGRDEIRMQTKDREDAFARSYGFEVSSVVMRLNLEGDDNGKRRTEADVSPLGGAAESGEDSGETNQPGDSSRGDGAV